ncbi:MAG: hemerythrin domain-containing protein [Elusimicrobiota bacterium]|jgi:hemerythrin-like domain-containing protein
MQAAIKELMDDHQVILRMLGALGGMAARIAEGGVVPADDLAAAVDFVRNFADAAHHGKEEDLLFPAMEEAGIPRDTGPIGVMLMEHESGRAYVRALRDAVERLKDGEKGAAKDAAENAANYAELLRSHIDKEDNILYPMALENLSASRFKTLEKEFSRVEAERMGPARRAGYVRLVERLEKEYPAPACGCDSHGGCG